MRAGHRPGCRVNREYLWETGDGLPGTTAKRRARVPRRNRDCLGGVFTGSPLSLSERRVWSDRLPDLENRQTSGTRLIKSWTWSRSPVTKEVGQCGTTLTFETEELCQSRTESRAARRKNFAQRGSAGYGRPWSPSPRQGRHMNIEPPRLASKERTRIGPPLASGWNDGAGFNHEHHGALRRPRTVHHSLGDDHSLTRSQVERSSFEVD